MQDLRQYSDDELSMWVFNDESLYRIRHHPQDLGEVLSSCFKYTRAQMAVLNQDLADDELEQ